MDAASSAALLVSVELDCSRLANRFMPAMVFGRSSLISDMSFSRSILPSVARPPPSNGSEEDRRFIRTVPMTASLLAGGRLL
jgi:hypothetical protein